MNAINKISGWLAVTSHKMTVHQKVFTSLCYIAGLTAMGLSAALILVWVFTS